MPTKGTKKKIPVAKKATKPAMKKRPMFPEKKKSKGLIPGAGGAIGSTAGGYFGGPVGAVLGGAIGNWFGRVTGLGKYKINSNSLLSQGAPLFQNSVGETLITHREFLGDIGGTIPFSNRAYSLNPGKSLTFPWLSKLAQNYTQYRFEGLIFYYRSTSGASVASTNTSLGTVVMATNYDVTAPLYTSKVLMESAEYANSGIPSSDQLHPVECDPRQNPLGIQYIRTDNAAGTDSRFDDLGRFQLATVGMPANGASLGELWVTYKVRLIKPRLDGGAGLICAHLKTGTACTVTNTFSVSGWGPLSGSTFIPSNLNRSNTITMDREGTYLISMFWSIATGVAAVPTVVLGANLAARATWGASNGYVASTFVSGVSATLQVLVDVVTPSSGADNTITVSGLTGMTAGTCDIFISQTSDALLSPTPPLGTTFEMVNREERKLDTDPSHSAAGAMSSSPPGAGWFRQ